MNTLLDSLIDRGDVLRNHKHSLQYGVKSIRYMGAKTWNELPERLKSSASKFSFKNNLKNSFKTLYKSELSRTRKC